MDLARLMKDYVLRRDYWRKRASFVHFTIRMPGGQVREEHFVSKAASKLAETPK